ncbi:MAG: AraC family transcriptional regulator [Paenibacillus sp.]|jgi:two-component system response regulator YesN|nr:AraC family transcriptional regulator [Paenibacillus sp.]
MLNKEVFFTDDEMLKLMRDRFLMSLVTKPYDNKHQVKEMLSYLKLNPYFTFPALALIEPAGSSFPESEKRRYMEEIRHYLHQHETSGAVIFMDGEGRLGILFSWVSKELIETIRSSLNHNFSHPVNIGVGKPCSQLADIHHSYNQALLALQDKFYKGTGEIVYFSEHAKHQKMSVYPIAKEKELFEYLKFAGSTDGIGKAVDDFYRHILQDGPVACKSIYELTIRLLIGMEKRVFADLEAVSAYSRYGIMAVFEMETLQEIKVCVSSHLSGLWEVLMQNDKESHRSIIKKTIQYMEQECQHATLYSVAQKVYMTPTYLSSLFKLNTGKTFIEQLTDIRISKAKDMLKSTHLKNYEVAEKVGYKDSRYFSQIFKKKVGVSPSEYRESIGQ